MKKTSVKFLSLALILALVLSLASCAAAMYDAYAPEYDMMWGDASMPQDSFEGEDYTEIVENPFVNTLEKPDSYFSIDRLLYFSCYFLINEYFSI